MADTYSQITIHLVFAVKKREVLMMGYRDDPDFDPNERAFYYIRVIEIPAPRWTTYEAKFFGVDLPEGVPASHQERAYTSPIWYTTE